MFAGLFSSFRRMNDAINRRSFGPAADTFGPYVEAIRSRLGRGRLRIVDLGAGRVDLSRWLPELRTQHLLAAVDGLRELSRNPLPTRVAAYGAQLPFRAGSVDLVVSACCFEHLELPKPVLRECLRVLKPGGALFFYTPHRWSYVAVAASLTPFWFHRLIRRLQSGASGDSIEVVPTYYRANEPVVIHELAEGFGVESLELLIGAPSYTTFLPPPVHLLFVWFHRAVRSSAWLRQRFGESLFGCLVKPVVAEQLAHDGQHASAGLRAPGTR